MIAFDEVAQHLGLKDAHPALRKSWPPAEPMLEQGRNSAFMPETLAESARLLGMPDDFIRDMIAAIPAAKADPVLFPYLVHCRHLLADPAAGWPVAGAGFPVIAPESSPAAGMGYALVFLDQVPAALERFRQRGVPDDVCVETLRDFARWTAEYKRTRGAWGLSNLGWLQTHLGARIFALGRLQFRLEFFGFDYQAWRDRRTGRVLLLAADGMTFLPPGLLAVAAGSPDQPSGAWTASFREGPEDVLGMPVHPGGWARPEPVRLAKRYWERVLKKGDPTVGIHIPAGGPMDFEACGSSFARASVFFKQHVPDHPVTALTCSSWLLDPQFEGRLPDSSNIVRFLREMYLHPVPGGTDYGLFERVFNRQRPARDASLEGMTTLQRGVMSLVREGGTWRSGGSLLFPGDLDWGAQVYRAMWPGKITDTVFNAEQG
jgi:hypothetical protein